MARVAGNISDWLKHYIHFAGYNLGENARVATHVAENSLDGSRNKASSCRRMAEPVSDLMIRVTAGANSLPFDGRIDI